MVQNVRDECGEFNRQYNRVIGCWRDAEEKPRRFESEFQSEAMLFHEAKNYVQEIQQQFGNVMQEGYGAGLRIQELENILMRERAQSQQQADLFTQDSYREFNELRERANRIRDEASEAIAAKDHQQFHARELISDEVMKLKQRNDITF